MKFSDEQNHSGFFPLLFIPHYVELCANVSIFFIVHTQGSLPSVMCNHTVYSELDSVTAHRSRLHRNKALNGLFSEVPFHSLN